jgi:hypothetical protein
MLTPYRIADGLGKNPEHVDPLYFAHWGINPEHVDPFINLFHRFLVH